MITKQIKLMLAGVVLGIALMSALTSGIFDEAGQYKAAQHAFASVE